MWKPLPSAARALSPAEQRGSGAPPARNARPQRDVEVDVPAPIALVAVENEPAALAQTVEGVSDLALSSSADEPVDCVVVAPLQLAEQHERESGQGEVSDHADTQVAAVLLHNDQAVEDSRVDTEQEN